MTTSASVDGAPRGSPPGQEKPHFPRQQGAHTSAVLPNSVEESHVEFCKNATEQAALVQPPRVAKQVLPVVIFQSLTVIFYVDASIEDLFKNAIK
jgi:hypothetical protein